MNDTSGNDIPYFSRAFFTSGEMFSRIGDGELGGKARGLVFIKKTVESKLASVATPRIAVDIPVSTVLTTDVFDAFMDRNDLHDIALSDEADDRIGHAFQRGDLPTEYLGDLRALIEEVRSPLAIRSSSLLEDAMFRPFAGVYQTKMIPNNQPDPDVRFRKFIEAIKFVYASTYSKRAKSYLRAADAAAKDEKMAVIIQEVVGQRYTERFYPNLSGVARSYNFYPMPRSRPEEGVVNLALGLGKTIVDGGISWAYSPAHPTAPPPFASPSDKMRNTQLDFWAVNMGEPPEFDPMVETEYLLKADLRAAEFDDTLKYVASTYDARRERIVPGTGTDGPRVLDFAPLLDLQEWPLNDLLQQLISLCEDATGTEVEIEFAVTFPGARDEPARFGFLQVRPMVVPEEIVEISEDDMTSHELLLASDRVMGNGIVDTIRDVVFVKPEAFEARLTRTVAEELDRLNRDLMNEERPYLLIGFGRWGSVDPWLGIPVEWGQIAGARAIVEATLPEMNVDPSQGSHFFHNISSFQVSYFSVHHEKQPNIDWDWLNTQETITETRHVRHVRTKAPLRIKVDGRSGRGAIWHA